MDAPAYVPAAGRRYPLDMGNSAGCRHHGRGADASSRLDCWTERKELDDYDLRLRSAAASAAPPASPRRRLAIRVKQGTPPAAVATAQHRTDKGRHPCHPYGAEPRTVLCWRRACRLGREFA